MKHLLLGAPHRLPAEAAASPHSKEHTYPLIDWREVGWELTLALNGLKYACTTFFFPSFAVRPNDIPTPDDLSSPFRAFMSGINWQLPCLMPLMDNNFIFLDYTVYTAIDPNQNVYRKHNARAILTAGVGAIMLTTLKPNWPVLYDLWPFQWSVLLTRCVLITAIVTLTPKLSENVILELWF